MSDRPLRRRRVEANGIRLAVVDEGSGPPVVLLHGFPDSADVWRHQVPALVDAGYRVVAPDLRGFGESDRPEGVASYEIPVVLEDVRALTAALGTSPFRLVGHDWGGVVGWLLAAAFPDLVERYAALGVGYASRRPTVEELEKYWYIFLWQLEGIAEDAIRASDWKLLREWMREGRPDASPDLQRSLDDLARPGALRAGLAWYRAIARPETILQDELPLPKVSCPVLGVWSEHDFLPESRMTASADNVSGRWRYERLDAVGHWIPTEAPDRLNPLLLEFLAGDR